jgi:hypothetical protein
VDFGTQRFFVMKHSCSLNNEENINFRKVFTEINENLENRYLIRYTEYV